MESGWIATWICQVSGGAGGAHDSAGLWDTPQARRGTWSPTADDAHGEASRCVVPAPPTTLAGPPSVLHQRADAARRGFDRADALVSVAQRYVRGDRPNRSPIEIVVTIAEASLRGSARPSAEHHPVARPVEVRDVSWAGRAAPRSTDCCAGCGHGDRITRRGRARGWDRSDRGR